jgi:RNA 3'-terminal phosphate cyclase (ATP)
MIQIDGSFGEGGGQILRSALALSLITREPFRIERIRARRSTPGLLKQHLTAVMAAARVGSARVEGAHERSQELTFDPQTLNGGHYELDIGSAGSTTLVLQTILVPLLVAAEPSTIELEGGTHNPGSPSFDFLTKSFLPLVARMGARVEVALERPGFFPAGGGRIIVTIEPARELGGLELLERGALLAKRARAVVSNLPIEIAQRELAVVGWDDARAETVHAFGPGNAITLEADCEHVTEVVTGFGKRGVRAEQVAQRALDEMQRYLDSDAATGEHLADQLLLPMAIGAGGIFTTVHATEHTTTNAAVIQKFINANVTFTQERGRSRVEVSTQFRNKF